VQIDAGHGCTYRNGLPRAWSEHMGGTSQAAGEVAHDTGEAVGIEDGWMRRWREFDGIVDGVWEDGSCGMRCAYPVFVEEHGEEMVRRICDDSRLTMDRELEAGVTRPGLGKLVVLRSLRMSLRTVIWSGMSIHRSSWARVGEITGSHTSSVSMADDMLTSLEKGHFLYGQGSNGPAVRRLVNKHHRR
jgi:hypothetical protein